MNKLEIPIKAEVFFKMWEYAAWAEHEFGSEISGFGFYNSEDGVYALAPLTEQSVGPATVDGIPDELFTNPEIKLEDMVFQWHSHVKMSPTASSVDVTNRKKLAKLSGMVITAIINIYGEHTATLTISKVGDIEFPEPIEKECRLVPYFSSEEIQKEVLDKLKKYSTVASDWGDWEDPLGIPYGSPGKGFFSSYYGQDKVEKYEEVLKKYGFKFKESHREGILLVKTYSRNKRNVVKIKIHSNGYAYAHFISTEKSGKVLSSYTVQFANSLDEDLGRLFPSKNKLAIDKKR